MKKTLMVVAALGICASSVQAHTCKDMRSAFDSGNARLGNSLVAEALYPQFQRQLNINDDEQVQTAKLATMYICKNAMADSLAEAGLKAAFYTIQFQKGAR